MIVYVGGCEPTVSFDTGKICIVLGYCRAMDMDNNIRESVAPF